MEEQRKDTQLDFMCPKCVRQLIASAHDGHLFCPDCGHQQPAPMKPLAAEEERFSNGE